MKKTLTMVLAFALVFALGVGGTLAWLTDSTQAVKNTFTTSDVDITLEETGTTLVEGVDEKDFKMVPGATLTKDPKVTVLADSEKCYVFVKVEESNNCDDFITYAVDESKWTALEGVAGVYYKVVESSANDQEFNVLTNNQVKVLESVTKKNMDDLTEATYPTLTFTAYAIQFDYLTKNDVAVTNAAGAWALIEK